MNENLEGLRPFATSKGQKEILDALIECNGVRRRAAIMLGIEPHHVRRAIKLLKGRQAAASPATDDMDKRIYPDYGMGKMTVQRGPGGVERVWERQSPQRRVIETWIKEQCETVKPLPLITPPPLTNTELVNCYTMTDCHVGMMAWHKEGGADWDLDIARATLGGCFNHMVDSAPDAEYGIVAQLGDWFHWDGLQAVTPTGGHILDADGRRDKVMMAGLDIFHGLVQKALEKHNKVILLIAEGNHDLDSSFWMRTFFKMRYGNEPRIEIIDRCLPFYAYRHGKTMVCWHHGHMKRNAQLPLMMAAEFPEIWGSTTKRYCHVGHMHHVEEKEHSGIIVRQHPTLAARDAYASRHGWHALRSACAITYHSEYGEVARNTVYPEML